MTRMGMSTIVARFVSRDTVVLASERDRSETNFEPLRENAEILRRYPSARRGQATDAGSCRVWWPAAAGELRQFLYREPHGAVSDFQRSSGSAVALATLGRKTWDRQVIGIHAGDLVWGLGTLHCMTQQQPG